MGCVLDVEHRSDRADYTSKSINILTKVLLYYNTTSSPVHELHQNTCDSSKNWGFRCTF